MPAQEKDLAYYLALPYSAELTPCEGGGYFARHPDLDGCAAQADEIEEALANLRTARELWLEGQLEAGKHIPEPPNTEPSGRLMLRVPLHLHAALERRAAAASVSLNRLLNEILFDHANGLPAGYGLERLASGASQADKPPASHHAAASDQHTAKYPYLLTPAEEGGYVVEHPDLPGCLAAGDTAAEAMAELDAAAELWIAGRGDEGLPIPAPLPPEHSGIVNLRMPAALHYQLARDATRNRVSLNQWLNMALAEFTGALDAREAAQWKEPYTADSPGHELARRVALPDHRRNDASPHPPPDRQLRNRVNFLAGLAHLRATSFEAAHLRAASFEAAFRSFAAAYKGGLSFTRHAVDLYLAEPSKLPNLQLLNLIFKLSQVIPQDAPQREKVFWHLTAWYEGVIEREERQDECLRAAREERAGAQAA